MTKYESPDKRVNDLNDIPTTVHWAIVTMTSVTTPGDERSRTHPGHGYPESTSSYVAYEVYLTEEKWKSQIAYKEEKKEKYRAMKVLPATVETSINVITKVSI